MTDDDHTDSASLPPLSWDAQVQIFGLVGRELGAQASEQLRAQVANPTAVQIARLTNAVSKLEARLESIFRLVFAGQLVVTLALIATIAGVLGVWLELPGGISASPGPATITLPTPGPSPVPIRLRVPIDTGSSSSPEGDGGAVGIDDDTQGDDAFVPRSHLDLSEDP